MNEPIDAVISWVDGKDPVYQHKLKTFCFEQGIKQNTVIEPTRIQQVNEIYYCLLSLGRFAPWIRSIYLITNQQIPAIVHELQGSTLGNKIKIIDQNELLNELNATSPVFNSISVEWLMWKIKGLSNHFIYLNDDFFIIRDVSPNDFFRGESVVLRGKWKTQVQQKLSYRFKKYFLDIIGRKVTLKTNPHRSWQEKSAQCAGWNKYFYALPHAPLSLIKQTFDIYTAKNKELFIENIGYPFRHPNQILSTSLMVHLDIKHKNSIFDSKFQSIMVNGEIHSHKKIKSRLKKAKKNQNVAFICMQSMDQADSEVREYMLNWLEEQIVLSS